MDARWILKPTKLSGNYFVLNVNPIADLSSIYWVLHAINKCFCGGNRHPCWRFQSPDGAWRSPIMKTDLQTTNISVSGENGCFADWTLKLFKVTGPHQWWWSISSPVTKCLKWGNKKASLKDMKREDKWLFTCMHTHTFSLCLSLVTSSELGNP